MKANRQRQVLGKEGKILKNFGLGSVKDPARQLAYACGPLDFVSNK